MQQGSCILYVLWYNVELANRSRLLTFREGRGFCAKLTDSAFLLSYSLVRSLLSRSASARRTVCCKRERSRFKSARGSLCRMVGVVMAVPWSTRAILSLACLFSRLGVDTSMATCFQSRMSNREVKHVIHGWVMWRELKDMWLVIGVPHVNQGWGWAWPKSFKHLAYACGIGIAEHKQSFGIYTQDINWSPPLCHCRPERFSTLFFFSIKMK